MAEHRSILKNEIKIRTTLPFFFPPKTGEISITEKNVLLYEQGHLLK